MSLFDTIVGYFKDKPYWSKIEGPVTFVSLYISTLVLGYQYVVWQYGFTPPLGFYVDSYLVKQLTIAYAALGTTILVMTYRRSRTPTTPGSLPHRALLFSRNFGRRLLVAIVVLVCFVGLFIYVSPHRVRHVAIRFLDEPAFDKYAFVYVVYELNRQQRDWHFDVDFDSFDSEAVLTEEEKQRCGEKPLCYAQLLAATTPEMGGFIGITNHALGNDHFWQTAGTVSAVSTFQWEDYSPPSVYEYLAYSIIVQSTVIHLKGQCGGLPEQSFEQSRSAFGDLFEFSPRRHEMKAAILTAHLTPNTQALLSNCFGLEYMNRCDRLLSLAWLHDVHVQENLQSVFHIRPQS